MSDNIQLFDKNLYRQKLRRAAPKYKNHNFLQEWSNKNIISRLDVVKKEFERGIYYGHDVDNYKCNPKIKHLTHLFIAKEFSPEIICDDEYLPLGNNMVDLFISNLSLHHSNDLLGALIQIHYGLKPDGVFIGTLFGGETLYELRDALQLAEIEIYGGLSPRVAPFADIKALGGLMQRTQYALPVIDSEKIIVEYSDLNNLFYDLRFMGESNFLLMRNNKPLSKKFWQRVQEIYQEKYFENGKFIATFEIIFLLGWKPHESQQKPLKPGSAEKRLADQLNVTEEIL